MIIDINDMWRVVTNKTGAWDIRSWEIQRWMPILGVSVGRFRRILRTQSVERAVSHIVKLGLPGADMVIAQMRGIVESDEEEYDRQRMESKTRNAEARLKMLERMDN